MTQDAYIRNTTANTLTRKTARTFALENSIVSDIEAISSMSRRQKKHLFLAIRLRTERLGPLPKGKEFRKFDNSGCRVSRVRNNDFSVRNNGSQNLNDFKTLDTKEAYGHK